MVNKITLVLAFLATFLIPVSTAAVSHGAAQINMPGGGTLESVLGNFPAGTTICTSANSGGDCTDNAGPWQGTNSVYYTGGNVGIGTTNPQNKLDVLDNSAGLWAANIAQNNNQGYGLQVSVPSGFLGNNPIFLVKKDSTQIFRIQGNGNVGIGTISPTRKLEVSSLDPLIKFSGDPAGNTHTIGVDEYGFIIFNDNAPQGTGYKFVIQNSGNIGIGTTSPAAKLDVVGDIKSSNNIYATNSIYLGSILNCNGASNLETTNGWIGCGADETGSGGIANWPQLVNTGTVPSGFADGTDDVGSGDNLGNHIATQTIAISSGDDTGIWMQNDNKISWDGGSYIKGYDNAETLIIKGNSIMLDGAVLINGDILGLPARSSPPPNQCLTTGDIGNTYADINEGGGQWAYPCICIKANGLYKWAPYDNFANTCS